MVSPGRSDDEPWAATSWSTRGRMSPLGSARRAMVQKVSPGRTTTETDPAGRGGRGDGAGGGRLGQRREQRARSGDEPGQHEHGEEAGHDPAPPVGDGEIGAGGAAGDQTEVRPAVADDRVVG